MDVRCNRCATEYDFDDALISERGTTVKCTNCGYQFKVFPPDAGVLAPERWVVRTASGREHVFTSLRDLQRGITEQKVAANDLLSRGRQPPRPLGSIAELEQFFSAPRSHDRLQRTLHGVAPPAAVPSSAPPGHLEPAGAPSPHELPTVVAPPHTEKFGKRSITVPLGTPPEPQRSTASQRATDEPPDTAQTLNMPPSANPYSGNTVGMAPPARVQPAYQAPPTISSTLQSAGAEPPPSRGSQPDADGVLPPPRPELRSSPRISGPMSVPGAPPSSRREFRSYDELSPESLPHPNRRARSRWIAAVVILGVLLLFAMTVGRRYLLQTRTAAVEPVTESDAKVAALLKSGTRLMDEGQLEEAGEQLLKATALAERNADVLAALARLSVLRADVHWLKLRLLDPKAEPLVEATHRELGRLIGRARSAVDAAFAVAPENVVVLRARVDALRLSGDQDTAREWIRPIASQPAEPANAYVLAALDLAESEPSWPSIIDRLKSAAAGEQTPGRAQVALVYALTRAGRTTEAQAELAKLEAARTAPLLLDELKSFVQRHARSAESSPKERPKAAVEPAKPGRAEPSRRSEPAPAANDFRRLLEQAAAALRGGDLKRAESLYQQVLAKNPGNTEALAGLGDVARSRNDPQAASRMYERVLANNPNYIPALLASADQKWEAGDRAGAVALYKRVLDQAGPSGEYGQRASARLAQANREAERRGEEEPAEATEEEPAPEPEPPPSEGPSQAPATPPTDPPPTDTTDIPELK